MRPTGLVAVFVAQRLQVAALVDHRLEEGAGGQGGGGLAQVVHEGLEVAQAGDGRRARHHLARTPQGLVEGHAVARGPGDEGLLRGAADAPLGAAQDAAPAHVVGRVQRRPRVGEDVLDLLAVVEAHPADDLGGDAALAQRLLEDPRLRVRPVQHGDVVVGAAPAEPGVHGARHEVGLRAVVVGPEERHRLALALGGAQHLLEAALVLLDQRVGQPQHRSDRAVVGLEPVDGGVLVVALEVEDVAQVGPAEGVDGLVGVADGHQVAVALRQQAGEPVLGRVGVLVLVDVDVDGPILDPLEHVGVGLEQIDGAPRMSLKSTALA
jgi:hypothetical protein